MGWMGPGKVTKTYLTEHHLGRSGGSLYRQPPQRQARRRDALVHGGMNVYLRYSNSRVAICRDFELGAERPSGLAFIEHQSLAL